MLSVYQHWDPLKVCAVGRSYPPEFYSFIENPKVRSVMERIAIETEEDYQKLIKLLESFGVTVIRTDISDNFEDHMWMERYSQPPMCPRDHTIMIGDKFFMPGESYGLTHWQTLADNENHVDLFNEAYILQDEKSTVEEKEKALMSVRKKIYDSPLYLQKDFINELKWNMRSINHDPLTTFPNNKKFDTFKTIREYVKSCGNKIITDRYISGSCTTRVGKDLYHGTSLKGEDITNLSENITSIYRCLGRKDYRAHIVTYDTHSDAVFVPVKEGLIISLFEPSSFEKTFPGWEVVSIPGEGWGKIQPFMELKKKNKGKWWVPGEELNDDFTYFVETWLKDWVLYVEETVFDINMLIIDEKNVVCNNYNEKVFDAFERHGITPHVVNLRHRYFWDGGLHCITSDLGREGTMKDYFPERNKK